MLVITLEVNAPSGSIQAVKETLAMYMERFGDTRVVRVQEVQPQQLTIDFKSK